MKPSETHVVFMPVGESASIGTGPTIVEVFKEKKDAEAIAVEIQKKVIKQWGWEGKELNESEKGTLRFTVKVITLEEAIKEIKDEIHDEYASQHPDY